LVKVGKYNKARQNLANISQGGQMGIKTIGKDIRENSFVLEKMAKMAKMASFRKLVKVRKSWLKFGEILTKVCKSCLNKLLQMLGELGT
jgi:hypothetical protein